MIGKYLKREGGFTLLELLIVIVVIGILALLIIPNLTSAPKKARDVQRKTDLRAVQKGLEEYFVSYSGYPAVVTYAALTTPLTGTTPPILKSMPTDPKNSGVNVYTYTSDGSTYTLKGCLENGADTGQFTNNDATCTGSSRNFQLTNQN